MLATKRAVPSGWAQAPRPTTDLLELVRLTPAQAGKLPRHLSGGEG